MSKPIPIKGPFEYQNLKVRLSKEDFNKFMKYVFVNYGIFPPLPGLGSKGSEEDWKDITNENGVYEISGITLEKLTEVLGSGFKYKELKWQDQIG